MMGNRLTDDMRDENALWKAACWHVEGRKNKLQPTTIFTRTNQCNRFCLSSAAATDEFSLSQIIEHC